MADGGAHRFRTSPRSYLRRSKVNPPLSTTNSLCRTTVGNEQERASAAAAEFTLGVVSVLLTLTGGLSGRRSQLGRAVTLLRRLLRSGGLFGEELELEVEVAIGGLLS